MKKSKWHIGDDGVARRCSAKDAQSCPLVNTDSNVIHGDSRLEVSQKYEESMSDHEIASPITVPHSKEAKYAVMSDVDGTLTKGSFVLDHAVYLHDKGIINLGDLPEKWEKDKKNEAYISELAESYKAAIVGKTEEEIEVDEFLDSYVANEENFYSTFEQLREFKRRGWEIQLISGSPGFLISRLAEKNGFHGVGSDYKKDENGRFTGEVDGMYGSEAKKSYIQKLKTGRFKRLLGMGDTASDIPILEASDHSTFVSPTSETSEKFEPSLTIYE